MDLEAYQLVAKKSLYNLLTTTCRRLQETPRVCTVKPFAGPSEVKEEVKQLSTPTCCQTPYGSRGERTLAPHIRNRSRVL